MSNHLNNKEDEEKESEQAVPMPKSSAVTPTRKGSSSDILMSNNAPATTTAHGAMSIGTKPTLIDSLPMRFLIMDAPRQGNLHIYIKEMRKHQVTEVVRVCEPTYEGDELNDAGINLHDMEYKDGTSPSKELIDRWLQLVYGTFFSSGGGSDTSSIAVHCVAGLGRAPVMVAIALIEFANMDPVEAVSFIRGRRRGAINEKQLLYLEDYKKQFRRHGGAVERACCVIL